MGIKGAPMQGLVLGAASPTSNEHPDPRLGGVRYVRGYRTGVIGDVTRLHARYYANISGFGCQFESVVASGLADFCHRLGNFKNGIWTAVADEETLGSIAIDGEDLGGDIAHLRWFIVSDRARGFGVGRVLLSTALEFVDNHRFSETHLWTFAGLHAARRMYEMNHFKCVEERLGSQWGAEVLEQKFVRRIVGA